MEYMRGTARLLFLRWPLLALVEHAHYEHTVAVYAVDQQTGLPGQRPLARARDAARTP